MPLPGAQAGAVGTCLAGPGDRLPPEEALKRQRDAAAALDAEVFFLLTLKVGDVCVDGVLMVCCAILLAVLHALDGYRIGDQHQ